MSLPHALASLRQRPGMVLSSVSYDAAVDFVQGYDAASLGGLLLGFREWLIVKVDGSSNLSWAGLVQEFMRQEDLENKSANGQEVALDFLFTTLETFLDERDAPDGVRRIYLAYDNWLTRQDWYGPSHPDWKPRGGE